jgi:two-component system alkaline phosphatase synthesis response regulator PhoP
MADKILIVDDEAPLRRLLQQSLEDLEDEGVEILLAEDGATALALIKSELPRLVFLDVMMPAMNGFEGCDAVKNNLDLNNVTIILLTAKGQESDRHHGQESGADMYLTKPFDPDELLDIAAEILGLDIS